MVTDQSPPPVISAADATVAVANGGGGGVNSPSQRRNLPSPWAAVVRGESEIISSPTAASTPGISMSPPPENAAGSDNAVVESSGSESPPDSSDVNGGNNAGPPRRPAWNRPVNGVLEPGSVMGGAVSWPALSESTRPGARSSLDTSRPVADGLSSSSQAPIISPPPQRPANNNVHTNSTANNPARPRSRNRGGGGGGGGSSSAGGPSPSTFSRPSPPVPPPFPVFEAPYGVVPPALDTSVRGARPVGGGSQPHTGNDHSSPRSNSRRGNYGPRPRGDGNFQNNHGGRRDQDRRDVPLSPQYVPPPMGFMPPPPLPPGATPFIAPQPLRVFPGPMGFDMPPSLFYVPTMPPESFRPMAIVPPLAPPMPFSLANENPLTAMIVQQIDYYFSDDNLVKDNFLRSNMDDHGWVPISLIASFRRVQQLTNDVQVILEALKSSIIVEVQGEKLRRRSEWSKWLPSGRINSDSGSHSPAAAPENVLASSLQELSLDDPMANANGNVDTNEGHTEMVTGRVLPEELTGQSRLANGEDTAEEVRSI